MPKPINNTAIGSALIIPDGLINKLGEVDKKIRDIQDASRATANVFNNSFASMSMGLKTGILTQLQHVINQLGSVGQAAQTASSATQNMGSGLGTAAQGATNLCTSVTGVVEAINRMIGQLQQTGQVGSSSLMAAKLAADKLMEAMQFKNSGNIAALKDEIQNINKTLKDTESALSRSEQQTLVERKRLLQEELKEAERTQNERAVNLQRVLDRMMRAEQSYQRQVQQNNKKTAQDYQKQNYASNTTYSGSLSFADNANTINRRTQAIKYLTEARNALSKTDADYTNKLATLNAKIKELNAENRQAIASSQELNSSHRRLMDTAGQLQRAFALLFSVSQIRGYVNQIAKVRGEFELQQRSLEAILQNKTEADSIFNKTVALAVQSPFQIRELVSYTKQLAAYRIESDKLYDTTKRLADVSAGLGVDMQRLILAYGQVKAAAYLRGTEVRQFTEAGINLYGELQRYFQEVKGEAYTTAQIVDMISKRMVTFEDVEQIFKRITDQGGIFYRMQEIQAETLQGKIANFKDSVDVMMNEIGKDNEGLFKGAIDSATALLGHWESVVNVGKTLVGVFILLKTQSMLTGVAMSKVFSSEFYRTSTKNATALTLLGKGFTRAQIAARNFGRSLKAAFMTNLPLAGFMIASEIVLNLINRQNEYSKSVRETVTEYNKSIYALKELKAAYSDTANSSDNASKKEFSNAENKREALEKLVEMMKKENLTIEFNVKDVSDSELEKYFKDSLERYEQFLKNKMKLDILYDKNKRDTFLVDNVEDDLKDYSDAASDLIAESDKIGEAIANLNAKYKELPESARIAFDELEKIKADDTNIDNIEERIKKLQVIYNSLREFDTATETYRIKIGWVSEATQINKLIRLYQKAQMAKEELLTVKKVDNRYIYSGELATIAAGLQKQYVEAIDKGVESGLSKAQARIQAAKDTMKLIDDLQAEKQINDFGAEILKTAGDYKFVLNFDKKKAEDDVYSIKKQLDSAFANNVYTISFKLAKLDSDLGYDELDKQMQGKLKDLQKLVTQRHNLEGGNYAGYDPIAQNARINELYNDITHMGKGYKEAADHIMGYDKANKASAKSAKAQRDILSEQISLLKEMQKRYENLQSVMGKSDAIQSVLQYYSDSLQNVKMPESIVNSFVPTNDGLINALEKLLPTINDFKKKMDVRNTIAELKVQIDKENLKTDLDKVKDDIEKAFNGLQLYKNLKDLGLSDVEVSKMFGNITKSFADVRKQIESDFTSKFGADQKKWGNDVADQYAEQMNKLDKQIYENSVSQFKELSKAYKDELDERLKIDLWYAEERKKIEENEQLARNPTLKDEYLRNLEKQRAQKSDEADWKQFQNSDFYIRIFENLETTSSRVLTAMQEKLASLRNSLKNLSPEQLKQVVDQMEKVDSQLVKRNPFKGLVSGIKDYIKFAKQRKQLETEYLQSIKNEDDLQIQKDTQTQAVENAKQRYELAVKIFGMYSPEAAAAERVLKVEQDKLDVVLKELVAQGKITEEYATQIRNGEKAKKTLKNQASEIAGYFSSVASGYGEVESMLQSFGVELPEEIGGALNGLSQTSGGISKILNGDVIGGVFSTIAGIGKTIGSIFGFGNKDEKLQKEIEDQQRIVERLERSYEKLKKSMDEAWSASDVINANNKIENNIKSQIASYEAMINAEQDKKKSDEGKINEWQNQIYDLKDTLKELEENAKEAFGGFGSEANYKSAAQEFADAWVDAFNESEDTLKALEDTFDNYFNNMLKKQLMQRAAQKYLKPIFDAFDKAVSEGSAGGNQGREVTEEEIARIQQLKDSQLKSFDEYAKALMKVLGIKPNGASTGELSKLQQGIQSLTESTGQALESLLNSIRFFVAQQSSDVSVIRSILQQSSNVDISSYAETPMLSELMAQTNILKNIYSKLDSVIRPSGHPKLGAGIKVFLD